MIRNRLGAGIAIASSLLVAAGCGGGEAGSTPSTSTGADSNSEVGGRTPSDPTFPRPPLGEDPADDPATPPGEAPGDEPGDAPGDETTEDPVEETGADPFGVQMIYPTKAGGEEWFLADDPTRDPRFDPQEEITPNEDGSWKMRSSKVRMSAKTSALYDQDSVVRDHDVLAERGYMQAPEDWKNVEMTGYVKVNGTNDESDNFAWYARGGRHSDGIGCEGSAYKGSLHYDGRTRWQKEAWHVSYDQSPYADTTSSIVGRWVGFKSVMRNVEVDGMPAVQLEMWLDDDADGQDFELVYEMVDTGDWGGEHSSCGGVDGMPITWGGPLAVFRWDSATDVDFKWMSVREIE